MVIVFGSINLDLIFPLPHLPMPGETVLGPSVRIEPGGKGANQALAAARDGAQVIMAGAIGRDSLGASALALLRQEGIDLTRVIETGTPTGCAAISVDPGGNNAIAVGSGANLDARHTQVEDALLTPAATLLLQMEVPPEQTAALILRAHAKRTRIILNLAPAAALAEDVLRKADILVVNETEAAWLAARLRRPLIGFGPIIIRTLGAQGLEADGAKIRAHEVAVVDTTAAGDCFTGVLAAALDRGLDLRSALHRANAAAALTCTRAGSQSSIPQATETDAFTP